MDKKSLWISMIAVVLSFIGGFLVANAINRSELESLRGENDRLKSAASETANTASKLTLTDQEIERTIAEADKSPSDFALQKRVGIALYGYGLMNQNPDIIAKSIPLLERALQLKNSDYDVIAGLGNAHFGVGYFGKDNEQYAKAREYYLKALGIKPDDIEVRTDLGMTYFLQDPADIRLAVENFQKSLKTNPSHEKTLQFMVQALIKDQRAAEAEKYLEQLRKATPNSPAVNELTTMVMNAKQGINK